MIRAFLVLVVLLPYTFLASALGYPLARLLSSPRLLYSLGRLGVRLGLLLAGIRVAVSGRERLADARNTVVMANHASHLDAPVIFHSLPLDYKVVAKAELFRFPFLNLCFRYVGFIEVDRADRSQSTRAIAQAARSLKSGACFLIFPEGTRSRTGEPGEFKRGGFVVALEAGSRIVPVAIAGAHALMPARRFRIRPGEVRVRVLDPVDAGGYSYDRRGDLAAEVRGRIAAALRDDAEAAGGQRT
jgi:1-acyl-sn-glycerol-3-phosphate acyltransferase